MTYNVLLGGKSNSYIKEGSFPTASLLSALTALVLVKRTATNNEEYQGKP